MYDVVHTVIIITVNDIIFCVAACLLSLSDNRQHEFFH